MASHDYITPMTQSKALDLKDLVGDPYYLDHPEEWTDRPDTVTQKQALEELRQQIDALPANYLAHQGVHIADEWGQDVVDPEGKSYFDEPQREGMSPTEKEWLYDIESKKVLGGWGPSADGMGQTYGMTRQQTESRMRELQMAQAYKEEMWDAYRLEHPGADPQEVGAAIARVNAGLQAKGMNPDSVIARYPQKYLRLVDDEQSMPGFTSEGFWQENPSYGSGRTILPGGGGGYAAPVMETEQPTDMVQDIRDYQRKSGYF